MQPSEIVTTFLKMCAAGDVRAAYERFVAADFVHHNPWFARDRQSLLEAMEQAAVSEPNRSFEPRQVVDGGERVAVLSHLRRDDGEYAVVHIARLHEGRIVELWDLGQDVPGDSPNTLGMF